MLDEKNVRSTYDRVAAHYARSFADELDGKPFDRDLLDTFAATTRGAGPVWDLGCGPGQVAAYLRARGVAACGLDLSPPMLAEARRLHPALPLVAGSMRAVPVADGALAGIVSFYAIIHLPRAEVAAALREFSRALRPGGALLLAVHGGAGELRTEGWFGEPVTIGATLFDGETLAATVAAAGFVGVERLEREPYPAEYPSRRIYLRARRG